MLLKVFDNYIAELMGAEVYLSSGPLADRCVYNRCRSRRQYLKMWIQLYQRLVKELQNGELQSFQQEYFSYMLRHAGTVFVLDGTEVVFHRHLLIHCGGSVIFEKELGESARCILRAYLKIQYDAWIVLGELLDSYLSVYRGYDRWTGQEIELLELGDALWTFEKVRPLVAGETKRLYFKRLFGYFNLPVPERPCHRLGEIGRRERPHSFLFWLQEKYEAYWKRRDLK